MFTPLFRQGAFFIFACLCWSKRSNASMEAFLLSREIPFLLGGLFFAILFLQSGLDKVFDWSGNLSWLKEHFAKSLLAGMVPTLLLVLTLMELASGLLSAVGVVVLLLEGSKLWLHWGILFSTTTLVMLFFGQRMAKDYAGAASLVPYFLTGLLLLLLLSGAF